MKLSYTLTLADYKAALRLHRCQSIVRCLTMFIYPVLTILFLCTTLHFKSNTVAFGEFFALGQCSLLLSIATPIARYLKRRKYFKNIFPPARTEKESSIDIDKERILTGIPGVCEVKFFWCGILEFAQNDKITMLYVETDRFLFFPTSAMSLAQRTELNELVARNVARK